MASREERMQQRLRGAQRRQVKDVDFGLVFPAPESRPDPPATQDSPEHNVHQPETLPQLSSRRTPNTRQQASNKPIAQELIRSAGSHSTIDANTSAKRRKLDSDNAPVSSVRSTRSQNVPRPDIYTLGGDPQDETVLDMLLDTTNDPASEVAATPILDNVLAPFSIPATRSRVQTPSLLAGTADEVTESPKDAPGSGHRIRGSGIDITTSSSRLQVIQKDSTVHIESKTPIQQNKRKRAGPRPQTSPRRTRRSLENKPLQDTSLELDELSPEQPSRITQTLELQEETQMSQDEPVPNEPEEAEEAEAIGDEQAAAILKNNKNRRRSRGAPATPRAVEEALSSPQVQQRRGRHHEASTTAQQRQPKQGRKKSKAVKIDKMVRIGSPIPVTVHRFTNPLVYDEDESDADILNHGIPHTKRAGVNTIDVLSEVCGEIVAAALQTLDDGGNACDDAALRREYRTKWQAVAAFGKELQTRLLEHTINLDNGYSLEKRLRVEQKRKIQLRDDVLRIRAEREQIALRMDKVRIRHETEKTQAQSRDELNANVHDIEMAIDLGKQRQNIDDPSTEMNGTEVLLKRVAGEVSNNSDSGGILRQIKEFNAFLERAALVLEAKKV